MAVLLILCAWPAGAAAQGPDPDPRPSPYLEPGHWALDALRRLDAAGVLPAAYDPASGVGRREAARYFRSVTDDGAAHPAWLRALASGYVARLEGEFGEVALARVEPGSRVRLASGRVTGALRSEEALASAIGNPPEPEIRPETLPRDAAAVVGVDVSADWSDRVAARVELRGAVDGPEVGEAYLVARLGPLDAWAGRRHLQTSWEESSLVASGQVPADGVGVVSRAFRLPGFARALGSIRLSTSLGRLDEVEPHDDPWLWLARVAVQPHDRVEVGLNRAAVAVPVEGDFNDRLRQVGFILIGKHGDTAEENWRDNQMASVDVRYRPPLSPDLPVSLYLEWGLEDSAGAWRDVPGLVAGAHLAAMPGARWLSVGLEGSYFAERCCGNIWWYRHSGFLGGWADARTPIGHPLGGHGSELAARADGLLLDGAVVLDGSLYRRDRGAENLFAPTFEGVSVGGDLSGSARIGRAYELTAAFSYEEGRSDWSISSGRLQLSWLF